jgi:iron complex outermembrane receptor protein
MTNTIRTALIVASLLPLNALAQSGSAGNSTSGAQAASDQAPADLDEVVVTARRREERSLDVPVAVTAISAATLVQKGVTDIYSLQVAAPNLQVSSNLSPQEPVYNIRGQPSGAQSYFNDVPWNQQINTPFYDMESIQVLAGASGTLFGRTAVGGAILFTPARPTFDLESSLQITTGSRDDNEYLAVLNLPIIDDKLAVRLAANVVRQHGYTYDVTTGQTLDDHHNQAARLSILYKPTDWLENYAEADWYDDNQNGYSSHIIGLLNTTAPILQTAYNLTKSLGPYKVATLSQANQANPCLAITGTSCPWGASTAAGGNNLGWPAGPNVYQNREWGLTDKLTFNFGDAFSIRNIWGYRRDPEPIDVQDLSGTPYFFEQYSRGGFIPVNGVGLPGPGGLSASDNNHYGTRQKSDEIHFYGTAFGKTLNWLVGYFYEDIYQETNPHASTAAEYPFTGAFGNLPYIALDNDFPVQSDNSEEAVFTQVSYDFGSLFEPLTGLSLTLGGRYTRDNSHTVGTNLATAPIFPGLLCDYGGPVATCYRAGALHDSGTNTNITIDYKINNDLMVYLATRTAYQPGGVNTQALPAGFEKYAEYGQERIRDAEVGMKNEWKVGDSRGSFDLALYHTWDNDLQRQEAIPGVNSAITENAAKAHVDGAEFQSSFLPGGALKGFRFSLYYNYTAAKYDSYPNPADPSIDFTVNPIQYSPKNKGSLSVSDEFRVGQAWAETITPSVTWTAQGRYYYTANAFANFAGNPIDPNGFIPGYALVNGRIDWNGVRGLPFQVSLFVRNMFDKVYLENGNAFANSPVGFDTGTYAEPRTWGISLRYQFAGAPR